MFSISGWECLAMDGRHDNILEEEYPWKLDLYTSMEWRYKKDNHLIIPYFSVIIAPKRMIVNVEDNNPTTLGYE